MQERMVIYSHSLSKIIGRKVGDDSMNKQPELLTLWIVRASNNKPRTLGDPNPDIITATYAYNQAGAEKNLATWFAQYPERPYHYFTEQPNGFAVNQRIWLPGSIPCRKATEPGPSGI
jgi:hypothetical protein